MRDESDPQDGSNPGGGRDEFDHFFTDRGARAAREPDADATAWEEGRYDPGRSGQAAYEDRTHAIDRSAYGDQHKYVQPPRPDEDYYGYERRGDGGPYYGAHHTAASGNVWAPVLVIVASLLVVGVVAFITLTRGNNDDIAVPQPTATVTQTQTQTQTQTPSPTEQSPTETESSEPSSPSNSPSPSQSFATSLPAQATPCPGGANYGTGPRTSCGFASVVVEKYYAARDDEGNASFQATSPETGSSYQVTCTAAELVTCVTNTNATVYLLRT